MKDKKILVLLCTITIVIAILTIVAQKYNYTNQNYTNNIITEKNKLSRNNNS